MQAALDLIYPRLCCVCHVPLQTEDRWFCGSCFDELPWIEAPYCNVCGEVYDGAFTSEFRCANCSGRRLGFEFAIAACRAVETMRELIHQFKYDRRLHLRGALASVLRKTLEEPRLAGEDLGGWLLVPVPLHRGRELDREFNQSWELCRRLAEQSGIPAARVLTRVRETDTQASLDREERLKNLRGAFALRRRLPWEPPVNLAARRVFLVDDVFTTGATTSECARVLRDGGAEKVVVITLARG